MTNKEKQKVEKPKTQKRELYIIVGIIGLLALIMGTILCVQLFKSKNTITENNINNKISDITVEKILFTNASITYNEGLSMFEVTIKNTAEEEREIQTVEFTFRDGNKKEMIKLTGYIGKSLQSGEETIIYSSVDQDIRQAKDVEYNLHPKK